MIKLFWGKGKSVARQVKVKDGDYYFCNGWAMGSQSH